MMNKQPLSLLKKVTQLLIAKRNFLVSRSETINKLRECCNDLETSLNIKFAIPEETKIFSQRLTLSVIIEKVLKSLNISIYQEWKKNLNI